MRQQNLNSSLSAIESPKACELQKAEAFVKTASSNDLTFIKAPFLPVERMVELIEPHRVSESEYKKHQEFNFKKWLNYEPKNCKTLNIEDVTLPKDSKDSANQERNNIGKEKINKKEEKLKEEVKKQADTIVLQKQQLVQSNTRNMELEKQASEEKKSKNEAFVKLEKLQADYNKLLIKLNENNNKVKVKNKLSSIDIKEEDIK